MPLRNSRKNIYTLLLIALLFGCKNENKKPLEVKQEVYTVHAVGQVRDTSYTFCSIIAEEVRYIYRIGLWSFNTEDNIKVAAGKYDYTLKEIDNVGGCKYQYFENSIDLKKWKFWSIDGQAIQPTKELIDLIESYEITHRVYLK